MLWPQGGRLKPLYEFAALTVFATAALDERAAMISHSLQNFDMNSNADIIVQFKQGRAPWCRPG
jgi:hypothetical protein